MRRSSSGAPRALVALVAACLLLAGCGSAKDPPRTKLARYLVKVNAVEHQLAKPLAQVTKADAQFAHDQSHPGAASTFDLLTGTPEHELVQAGRQVRALRRRLAAIPPPQVALPLRRMVLRLIDAQTGLTQLSAKLVVFLPGFASAMKPLVPAIRSLERVLSINQASGPAAVAAVYSEKEAALLRFKATLDRIVHLLRRLPVPQPLKPNYRAELHAVQGMSASAGRLARALQQGTASVIPQLLNSFDEAALLPQTRSAQETEIKAIKTYNARVSALNTLAEAAQRERERLAAGLG